MVKKVSPEEKALQYIASGRLKVVHVNQDMNEALVHVVSGSADVTSDDPYSVRFDGEWHCTCQARTLLCVHVRAAQKVVSLNAAKPKIGHMTNDTDWLNELLGMN
jgi:hypothetical protein